MGKYNCSLKEKITYSNVGSTLIAVGVPLTILPILIATGTFGKDTLNGTFIPFTPIVLRSTPTTTYFTISVLGTVSTLIGITLEALYVNADISKN